MLISTLVVLGLAIALFVTGWVVRTNTREAADAGPVRAPTDHGWTLVLFVNAGFFFCAGVALLLLEIL